MKTKILTILIISIMVILVLSGCEVLKKPSKNNQLLEDKTSFKELKRFASGKELMEAFEKAREKKSYGAEELVMVRSRTGNIKAASLATSTEGASRKEFSTTNIQVEGVDEADIIKTDGDYIYILANNRLIIAHAYPPNKAEILSTTKIKDFYPHELFIHDDKLLVFGNAHYRFEEKKGEPVKKGEPLNKKQIVSQGYFPEHYNMMSIRLYDISDREKPKHLRTVDFEGNYLTSRKIGEYVYFVVNSYPKWYPKPLACEDIIPLFRDSKLHIESNKLENFQPIVSCTDIGYIEPLYATNFFTIASISMADPKKEIKKEVIAGQGENVYASINNMYIVQSSWPIYQQGEPNENEEKTIITKMGLQKGNIKFLGKSEVPGHILNQFSMDEFDGYFRIATTRGNVWEKEKVSSNNIYILNKDMKIVGKLEDLAPGEKIYSVRFMGKKGYVVTFKKVDPLFVIDLEDQANPRVLGKLKIPGYSDYLHPIDETHILGIGKETVEANEELKENRGLDFAWYQGIKMAIFDVSDVENPVEMYKEIIGDRGTESEALHNHKAFLFDKDKELMVIPITLAEIKGKKTQDNQYGEFTFQGVYVYKVNVEEGFKLLGRISHYDNDEAFKKSGYFFRGDSSVKRSLFIENILYTLSNSRLQLNDLDNNLQRLKILKFEKDENNEDYRIFY